eukprot:augustus_masked-scaffold_1-processed-gene-28.42-mRNA-1 protein AED:0.27 eAED:0.36 QI:0/-1/0/1/-1/1/1/0/900
MEDALLQVTLRDLEADIIDVLNTQLKKIRATFKKQPNDALKLKYISLHHVIQDLKELRVLLNDYTKHDSSLPTIEVVCQRGLKSLAKERDLGLTAEKESVALPFSDELILFLWHRKLLQSTKIDSLYFLPPVDLLVTKIRTNLSPTTSIFELLFNSIGGFLNESNADRFLPGETILKLITRFSEKEGLEYELSKAFISFCETLSHFISGMTYFKTKLHLSSLALFFEKNYILEKLLMLTAALVLQSAVSSEDTHRKLLQKVVSSFKLLCSSIRKSALCFLFLQVSYNLMLYLFEYLLQKLDPQKVLSTELFRDVKQLLLDLPTSLWSLLFSFVGEEEHLISDKKLLTLLLHYQHKSSSLEAEAIGVVWSYIQNLMGIKRICINVQKPTILERLIIGPYMDLRFHTSLDKLNKKIKYRTYQIEAIQQVKELNAHGLNSLLFDDLGLGKTLMSLSMALNQIGSDRNNSILVVCPRVLLHHWFLEAKKFFPDQLLVLVEENRRSAEQFLPLLTKTQRQTLFIISYNSVSRLEIDFNRTLKGRIGYLILDEAHHLRNPGTKRYKKISALRQKCDYIVLLTATPFHNNILDIFAYMNLIHPYYLCAGSIKNFNDVYVKPIQKYAYAFQGVFSLDELKNASEKLFRDALFDERNLSQNVANYQEYIKSREKQKEIKKRKDVTKAITHLKAIVSPFILRRNKRDPSILPDLPSKIITFIGVELTTFQAELYTNSSIKLKGRSLAKLCTHPALVAGSEHLFGRYGEQWSLKLEALAEILVGVPVGQKTVIFLEYAQSLRLVHHYMQQVLPEKHTRIVTNVTEDLEKYDILVVTKTRGGEGLNFTFASNVIVLEPSWNPQKDVQAVDRLHRIGQKSVVNAYFIYCKDSIEEDILKKQFLKMEVARAILE